MSRVDEEEEEDGIRHPRQAVDLIGHEDAERTLLETYAGGRMPHAWLIGGVAGIGKATLAYRLARFVLAHPDPRAASVQAAKSLAVDPDHPVFHRVAARGHPDVLALHRVINEKTGKFFTEIRVDDVRRTVKFFGSTAGEGGWRVCIVDPADELNASGANALLKIIEEPPARSLLLVLSHAPGRLLPTIRSRCRRLMLRPLGIADAARVAAEVAGRSEQDTEILAAAAIGEGSVGRTLALIEGSGLALRRQVTALLDRLPDLDPRALHALGESLAGTDAAPLTAFVDTIGNWLSAQVRTSGATVPRLAQVADVWEKVNSAAQDVETYNLDRKPLVFNVFGLLAEAVR